jgi:excisionase family DNA binding protein
MAADAGRKTVTVEQACRILGIGRSLGYELAAKGQLPGILRLGRKYVVSRRALDRALDAAGTKQEGDANGRD